MAATFAVGIDLGTTYSCVAVYRNDEAKVLPNDHGNNITASYVAFTDFERLIGDAARAQVFENPQNTVFDAKRLIGRKYDDATIQEDRKHWPFKIVSNAERPNIQVNFKRKTKTFSPEEISSMVLTKMKETAETYLRQPVKDAVITVPAYFTDAQRTSTKDAATIAGLNVLRILNEPTAAGIAYGLEEKATRFKNVLIYDFGGGTFDVTIMSIKGGKFIVRATSGDTHLGGEDMDSRLVDYVIDKYKKEHGKDLDPTEGDRRRIRLACEKAKRTLSFQLSTTIEGIGLSRGINYLPHITRACFEELCADLFKRTQYPVEKVLQYAKMSKDQIDEVVLVGGTTRIPKIQKMLSAYFGEKKVNKGLAPDEAVARGAAIEAASLVGMKPRVVDELVISDVTPFSLGIQCTVDFLDEVDHNYMSTIIEKNTAIPVKIKKGGYATRHDFQSSLGVLVFEGEDSDTTKNQLLGRFTLNNIRRAPRVEVKFEFTFEIDKDGILNVSVLEEGTENSASIKLTNTAGYLTKEEILHMVENEKEYRQNDSKRRRTQQYRNDFEAMRLATSCGRIYPNIDAEVVDEPTTSSTPSLVIRPTDCEAKPIPVVMEPLSALAMAHAFERSMHSKRKNTKSEHLV